jgi:hypothetical protein
MSPRFKIWSLFASMAAVIAFAMFILNLNGIGRKAWQSRKQEKIAENADLRAESKNLHNTIDRLQKQNKDLMKYIASYEENLIALEDTARNCCRNESMRPLILPKSLAEERIEIRHIYRRMTAEKRRWDRYQQEQYEHVLEDRIEPRINEVQSLNLENEENREYFLELEGALKLHRRLIRDVRLFHDEIQYRNSLLREQKPYQLYDLKFRLGPFAREAALTDAMQQAMSAMSAGIYQEEAAEVLQRIGKAFTRPIEQIYEQRHDPTVSKAPGTYNFNFLTLYGKKLMDYSDTLSRQSAIPLGPSAFGELDFFNRRMVDSLYDLYEVSLDEPIDPSILDIAELEQVLQLRH